MRKPQSKHPAKLKHYHRLANYFICIQRKKLNYKAILYWIEVVLIGVLTRKMHFYDQLFFPLHSLKSHFCILTKNFKMGFCNDPMVFVIAIHILSFTLLQFSYFMFWFSENSTNLDKFHLEIRQNELYPENSTLVDKLLQDMATHQILHVGK